MRVALLLLLAASAATAQTPITPGVAVLGTLDQAQHLYRFAADEGDVLELHVEADFDPVLELRGTNGTLYVTDDDGGEGLRSYVRQFVAPLSGAYVLAVRSFNTIRGDYSALVRVVGSRGPQECTGNSVSVEELAAGDRVLLGRHRAINGDDNWATEMETYVGRETTVVEHAGVDGEDCPVVHVAIDGGEFFWRVRDLAVISGAPLSVQACGLDLPVDFRSVTVGSEVTLARHRPVDGEANWADEMNDYVGRTSVVTNLVGTDPSGCGVINVSIDEGAWMWRVRDTLPVTSRFAVPQACGQSEPLDYGPVRVGATVRLGHHRPVEGDDNWADDMDAYVGRLTTVSTHEDIDAAGCPVVTVAADGGDFVWRVRDLSVVAQGVGLPQACESAVPDYGTLSIGTRVRLGEHRPVAGDTNWTGEMDAFVDDETRVTSLEGVDGRNCTVVKVERDGGAYFWRVRDLTLLE